jgi:hypothetical protein
MYTKKVKAVGGRAWIDLLIDKHRLQPLRSSGQMVA